MICFETGITFVNKCKSQGNHTTSINPFFSPLTTFQRLQKISHALSKKDGQKSILVNTRQNQSLFPNICPCLAKFPPSFLPLGVQTWVKVHLRNSLSIPCPLLDLPLISIPVCLFLQYDPVLDQSEPMQRKNVTVSVIR